MLNSVGGVGFIGRPGLVTYKRPLVNLLKRTEEFSTSPWTLFSGGTGTNPVLTPNSVVAPNGTLTAFEIVFDKGSGSGLANQSVLRQWVATQSPATNQTHSIYIKAPSPVSIVFRDPTSSSYFLVNVTTDWTRISVTGSTTIATSLYEIGLRGVSLGEPNTATVHIWGAQAEVGTTLTEYQRVGA